MRNDMADASRLPPVLIGVVAIVGTLIVGFAAAPPLDSLRYLAAFVWSCLLPGMAVHRALRGRPDALVSDLTLGAATGIAVQLAGWAAAVGTGASWLQLAWPVLVVGACVAVPTGRERILRHDRYPQRVGHPSAMTACLAGLLALFQAVADVWSSAQLPPGPTAWYQDLYWYLGNTAELGRTIAPQTVQALGDPFLYHWFSMATMASLHAVSGVALPTIVGRLWLVPFVWMVVGSMLALSLRLTGRAAAGALAAVWCILSAELRESSWYQLTGFETMVFLSPSQVFGIPVLALAVDLAIQVARGERLGRGGWVLLALCGLVCAGAKSSILPVLVCAFLLVIAVALLRRRPVRGPIAGLIVVVGAMVAGLPMTQSGSAGTHLQAFAIVGSQQPWRIEFGAPPLSTFTASCLPGITTAHGFAVLALTLAAYGVHALWALPGLRPLARHDPAAWLLAGLGIAGFAGLLLINHDGLSQAYFMRGIMPFAFLLGAWGVVDIVDPATPVGTRAGRRMLAAGAAAGLLILGVAQTVGRAAPAKGYVVPTLALSLAVILTAVVAVLVALWVLRGRPAARTLAAAAASGIACAASWTPLLALADVPAGTRWPLAFTAAAALAVALWPQGRAASVTAGAVAAALAVALIAGTVVALRLTDAVPPDTTRGASADEYAAARWIADNTGPFDVVATNAHCRPKKAAGVCDARTFWVSGFTERRVLIEGWGYTVQAHEAHGVNGLSSRVQPFHDQALFVANEAAFYKPTPAVLQQLRGRGVRWLYADNEVAQISPALATMARPVFTAGPVTVYDIAG